MSYLQERIQKKPICVNCSHYSYSDKWCNIHNVLVTHETTCEQQDMINWVAVLFCPICNQQIRRFPMHINPGKATMECHICGNIYNLSWAIPGYKIAQTKDNPDTILEQDGDYKIDDPPLSQNPEKFVNAPKQIKPWEQLQCNPQGILPKPITPKPNVIPPSQGPRPYNG